MNLISRAITLGFCCGALLSVVRLEPAYAMVASDNVQNQTRQGMPNAAHDSNSLDIASQSGLSKSLETSPESETEAVRLVLKLSERRVYVYRGESVETSYPVAIGKNGWETPTGDFQIFAAIENPGWTNPFTRERVPPGPNNPMGDRWLAFWSDEDSLIGFHGTPDRASVGQAVSHGCVRMYNEDIREMFEIVEIGTLVTVLTD